MLPRTNTMQCLLNMQLTQKEKVGKALSMKSDTCIETPLDKSPAGTSLSFWVKKGSRRIL